MLTDDQVKQLEYIRELHDRCSSIIDRLTARQLEIARIENMTSEDIAQALTIVGPGYYRFLLFQREKYLEKQSK